MSISPASRTQWKRNIEALTPVLKAAGAGQPWPSAADVEGAVQKVSASIEKDLGELEKGGAFIFDAAGDSSDLTRKTADMLWRWHKGNEPSLAALCAFAVESLGLQLPQELADALMAAAVLGEVE